MFQSGRPWLEYALDQEMAAAPGEEFAYNSGVPGLLAPVIRQSVGKSARDFAEETLFADLGINAVWHMNPPLQGEINFIFVVPHLDLVGPGDQAGRYYELDVTSQVLADYAADGSNAFSAFRLQVTEAVFAEDNVSGRYRLAMPGAAINRPELLLVFVPEPAMIVLAAIGLAGLFWGRRRLVLAVGRNKKGS